MIWAVIWRSGLGVPLWLCALGILALVYRNRALRKRFGDIPVRVLRAGKSRWTRGHGVWISDVFAWRGSPAAWKEDLFQVIDARIGLSSRRRRRNCTDSATTRQWPPSRPLEALRCASPSQPANVQPCSVPTRQRFTRTDSARRMTAKWRIETDLELTAVLTLTAAIFVRGSDPHGYAADLTAPSCSHLVGRCWTLSPPPQPRVAATPALARAARAENCSDSGSPDSEMAASTSSLSSVLRRARSAPHAHQFRVGTAWEQRGLDPGQLESRSTEVESTRHAWRGICRWGASVS